jgi:Palmitoyl protein thioesterase
MTDATARLLPGGSRRRRWEWRAVAVVVIVALCAFAATSRIRIRAHVPHSRHHRPAQRNDSSLPVVLWHGLGDSCCASHSIGYIANLISDSLGESETHDGRNAEVILQVQSSSSIVKYSVPPSTGVYVHSIATGEGTMADISSTFFGNVNEQVRNCAFMHCNGDATAAAGRLHKCIGCPQVAKVCEELASMPELVGGFNAIGFSQGATTLVPTLRNSLSSSSLTMQTGRLCKCWA